MSRPSEQIKLTTKRTSSINVPRLEMKDYGYFVLNGMAIDLRGYLDELKGTFWGHIRDTRGYQLLDFRYNQALDNYHGFSSKNPGWALTVYTPRRPASEEVETITDYTFPYYLSWPDTIPKAPQQVTSQWEHNKVNYSKDDFVALHEKLLRFWADTFVDYFPTHLASMCMNPLIREDITKNNSYERGLHKREDNIDIYGRTWIGFVAAALWHYKHDLLEHFDDVLGTSLNSLSDNALRREFQHLLHIADAFVGPHVLYIEPDTEGYRYYRDGNLLTTPIESISNQRFPDTGIAINTEYFVRELFTLQNPDDLETAHNSFQLWTINTSTGAKDQLVYTAYDQEYWTNLRTRWFTAALFDDHPGKGTIALANTRPKVVKSDNSVHRTNVLTPTLTDPAGSRISEIEYKWERTADNGTTVTTIHDWNKRNNEYVAETADTNNKIRCLMRYINQERFHLLAASDWSADIPAPSQLGEAT